MNGAGGALLMSAGNGMESGIGSKKEERRKKREELKQQLQRIRGEIQSVEKHISNAAHKAKAETPPPLKQTTSGRTSKPSSRMGDDSYWSPEKRGTKRKSEKFTHPESREAKKQVVLKERARRVQSIWGQCATILKQLKQNRSAWPFHKPVDWRGLNLPDYPNIVKDPMDMQTISEKLGGFDAKCKEGPRTYKSPIEFRDDIRKIFDNCKLYNPVGSDVRIMGDSLADVFEKKWQNSNLEGKFALELEHQNKEDEELKNLRSGVAKKQTTPMSSQIQYLESEINKLKQGISGPGGKKVAGAQKAGSGQDDQSAEMTFEEKRKLSVKLGMLPAEKLGKVIEIIQQGPSKLDNSSDEIELDLDVLDNQTLWKLERFTSSVLGKGVKKSSQQDKIQRMQQQQQETAKKLEDVNATLATRSAQMQNPSGDKKAGGSDFSPVNSKPRARQGGNESDSSDSESESQQEGIGSEGDNDMKKHGSFVDVTRASTTRPHHSHPQILKDTVSNREVNLKNAAAWETLNKDNEKKHGQSPDGSNAVEAKSDGDLAKPPNNSHGSLWSEFQSKELKMKAMEKSKEEQAQQMRAERERAEEERKKKVALGEAEKQKELDAIRSADKNLAVEKSHQIALDIAEQSKIMKEQETKGNMSTNILQNLGVSMMEQDDDSFEIAEDDAEDGEL